ncbi:MAG: peptidylprolyl isomerase, partial [Planctomycetota bacterium]|nr:peptidylprolyl isomerase [Planctomycetota bacterium]
MTKKFIRKLFPVRGVGRCSVIAICGGGVIVAAVVFRAMSGSEDVAAEVAPTNSAKASASRTSRPPAQARKPSPSDIVAVVSGRKITRSQLGKECLKHYRKQVIESVVNRYLIELECQKFGVEVTEAQIDEEIDRIAQRFSLPVDQWLDLLKTERNISVPHYRMEIIWPTLALRKLAAGQLRVTDNEVVKEFETRFGPQVQIRMISVKSRDEASQLQKHLGQKPADFPRVAAKHSTDINSASAGGLVQPIRKHVGEPEIEQVAFNMREGEISKILPLGDQFLILKCEKHIDPRPPAKQQMKQARDLVVESIRDRKIRVAGGKLFKRLQTNANVQNVLDDPVLSKKMPGVAATL